MVIHLSEAFTNVISCRGATTFSKLRGVQFLGLGYCTKHNTDGIPSFVHCYVKRWGGPSNFWGSPDPPPTPSPSGCALDLYSCTGAGEISADREHSMVPRFLPLVLDVFFPRVLHSQLMAAFVTVLCIYQKKRYFSYYVYRLRLHCSRIVVVGTQVLFAPF